MDIQVHQVWLILMGILKLGWEHSSIKTIATVNPLFIFQPLFSFGMWLDYAFLSELDPTCQIASVAGGFCIDII